MWGCQKYGPFLGLVPPKKAAFESFKGDTKKGPYFVSDERIKTINPDGVVAQPVASELTFARGEAKKETDDAPPSLVCLTFLSVLGLYLLQKLRCLQKRPFTRKHAAFWPGC